MPFQFFKIAKSSDAPSMHVRLSLLWVRQNQVHRPSSRAPGHWLPLVAGASFELHRNVAKYLYARMRKIVSDITKYHDNMSTTTVDMLFAKYLSDPTSTPMTCVPLPLTLEDPVDVKFLTTTPNIYGLCTATSTTAVYHYFHYRRENVYFLYIAPNSIRPKNARFEGITTRRPPVNVCLCVV